MACKPSVRTLPIFEAMPAARKYIFLLLLGVLFAHPASAYIDPGSGSYLIQAILAGLLGVLYFFKGLRTRVMAFFATLFGRGNNKHQAEE